MPRGRVPRHPRDGCHPHDPGPAIVGAQLVGRELRRQRPPPARRPRDAEGHRRARAPQRLSRRPVTQSRRERHREPGVAVQREAHPPAVARPRLGAGLQPGDPHVGRRRRVGTPHQKRQAGVRGRDRAGLQIAQEHDLPGPRLGPEDVAGERQRRAEIEPLRRDLERVELRLDRRRVAALRHGVGGQEPERVVRRGACDHRPRGGPELRQPRRAPDDRAAAGGVVHDQHQRARGVAGHAAHRRHRPRRREHQRDDQQRAHQQEQQVLELEPALVLARGRDQVTDRGEDHGGGLAAREQVEQNRDPCRCEPGQDPGVEEADHPARASDARACRRAVP